jgi:hypothetical protein
VLRQVTEVLLSFLGSRGTQTLKGFRHHHWAILHYTNTMSFMCTFTRSAW